MERLRGENYEKLKLALNAYILKVKKRGGGG